MSDREITPEDLKLGYIVPIKEKQEYTLGFIFSEDYSKVLLIKKNRGPKGTSMKNRLNGVGGKLEINEDPTLGMIRECKEETGLDIKNWNDFCLLSYEFGIIYCYYVVTDDIFKFQQIEDEELKIYDTKQANMGVGNTTNWFQYYNRMPNLDWLIPMALNQAQKLDNVKVFEVKEI